MKNLLENRNCAYVEYYVKAAKTVAYWHVHALGFEVKAYCGPDTGVADKVSYFLQKEEAKLLITSPTTSSNKHLVSFVNSYGNGVKRIFFETNNVQSFYKQAIENRAIPIQSPYFTKDNYGKLEQASIKLFNDHEIVFIDTSKYTRKTLPGYVPIIDQWIKPRFNSNLTKIDHIAFSLKENKSPIWKKYLDDIFSASFRKAAIEMCKPDLVLKVLQAENKSRKNVLVKSNKQASNSKTQAFDKKNDLAATQHIAFSTPNIFKTLDMLKQNGVSLSKYPAAYYDLLKEKHPNLDITKLKKYNILIDIKNGRMLLHTFITPTGDRSTLFYEIVQRVNGYQGFGLDNIQNLAKTVRKEFTAVK